jgi:hypothetical protein
LIVDHEFFLFLLQLKILTIRATNIRALRGVRVAGIFNSIKLARDGLSCHNAQPVLKLAATRTTRDTQCYRQNDVLGFGQTLERSF